MEHFFDCLNRFQAELAGLETQCRSITSENADRIREACWRHAQVQFDHAVGRDIASLYKAHPVAAILNRSAFISSALEKKFGYAGDKDLMEMIYDNGWTGADNFSRMLNAVYLNLPAAEAVRQRMRGITRKLNGLPDGARALNVACGSARELAGLVVPITVDLADHDPNALAHAARYRDRGAGDLIVLNAFEFIKGRRSFDRHGGGTPVDLASRRYDLIYSCGLFDYVPVFEGNPARGAPALAAGLFELLKPGGQLIIGNFAEQGPRNPHLPAHRLMMELYSEWRLIYRTKTQMLAFARSIPADTVDLALFNERFEDPDENPVTLWYLVASKR